MRQGVSDAGNQRAGLEQKGDLPRPVRQGHRPHPGGPSGRGNCSPDHPAGQRQAGRQGKLCEQRAYRRLQWGYPGPGGGEGVLPGGCDGGADRGRRVFAQGPELRRRAFESGGVQNLAGLSADPQRGGLGVRSQDFRKGPLRERAFPFL